MSTHRNDGAAAPGPVTPTNDNARASGRRGEQAHRVSLDCAAARRRAQRLRQAAADLALTAVAWLVLVVFWTGGAA